MAELVEAGAAPGGVAPREGLERVSTVFAQFESFAESVRDFYAYLGQVIFRYDLDGGEFAGFKELLLDYAETITDDVARFAPQIQESLTWLRPRLPLLLARLDEADHGLAGLAEAGGVQVQRSRGRELSDWDGLQAWFFDLSGEGSQVDQLRDATLRALQALLANAKRMIRSSTGGMSRHGDLLRLARWFDQADDQTAHDLFVAAFGLYSARHLGFVNAPDGDVPATTSWWDAAPVAVPVTLRERGDRAARGRTAAPEDYSVQRDRLRREAEEQARRQRAAAAELRAAGPDPSGVRLSESALRLLLDLLARALGGATPRFTETVVEDDDLGLRLRLVRNPGREVPLRSAAGELVLDGLQMEVTGLAAPDERQEETG
ncbi:DUF2397 domain-containing protein [Spirillospora sp. NPDC049652]